MTEQNETTEMSNILYGKITDFSTYIILLSTYWKADLTHFVKGSSARKAKPRSHKQILTYNFT